MFENKNERKKTKQVQIPLPRASRNFPDVKTSNEIFFHNWTSEIRDHPFKTSACLRGGGVKDLPNLPTGSTKKLPS